MRKPVLPFLDGQYAPKTWPNNPVLNTAYRPSNSCQGSPHYRQLVRNQDGTLTTIHLTKLGGSRTAYTCPRQSPTAASLAMTASSIHRPEPSLRSAH